MSWRPEEIACARRWAVVVLMLLAIVHVNGVMQSSVRGLEHHLERMSPEATRFSGKTGTPPHIRAYRAGGDTEVLLGFAFSTLDLEPLERGYEEPIETLVGMDTAGKLRGVEVISHREPYGYFSIDVPEFAEQFEGKNILERFRVGDDIDGVSTATITVSSATRAIRKSARRLAKEFLTEADNDRR